jgi:glycosyltransferase involved in cell wall biosynthesis
MEFRMISLIIPVYNEQDNLQILQERIIKTFANLPETDFEIIYIDDGSSDSSLCVLRQLKLTHAKVRVIALQRNHGQTAAMMAGFDAAHGEIIIPLDADLQNPPEEIPKLLTKLNEGFDVVSGWRKSRQDHRIKRVFVSKLANWIISKVSGVQLHDYGCSLKAYRKKALSGVRLYGEMHRFIPIYAAWQGAKITEIPVEHSPRLHGESKYGIDRTFRVICDLIVVKLLDKFLQKPMHLFGMSGLFAGLLAILSGFYAIFLKIVQGTSFIKTPLPLFSGLACLSALILILMGFLAEISIRTYYESRGLKTYLAEELEISILKSPDA